MTVRFAEGAGRVSPRRARYLFFASPKKSTQKKSDPAVCDPCAALGLACQRVALAPANPRPSAAMARPVPPPSGCACGGVLAGWRVCRRTHPLRPLTRRGCPNGAPQARSEFHGAPRKHPGAGVPRRGRRLWGAYRRLLSCRAQERRSPAGASPGLRTLQTPHRYSQAPSCRAPTGHAARADGAQAQDCTLRVFWGFGLKGQAQAAIVFIVTGMPLQRTEAGSRPACE